MMEIPDIPFDKIAINLVTECETSTSGNKHILTIIDHVTGWPEAYPIPDKTVDTIVSTFINEYLPVHMCPHDTFYHTTEQNSKTWSHGTKFCNNLELTEYFQHHIIHRVIASWKFFHKYLKPTLKKLYEKDPSNWDKYLNQILTSYRVPSNLATAETPFFLVYGRDPNLPLHQLLEPMQHFLGDPDSGMLNLETHRLALAIAKKTLDENRFKMAQKTMDHTPPSFKIGDRVYFKNKQPSKWDLKWRPGYRVVQH